jgi:hypothetical protein
MVQKFLRANTRLARFRLSEVIARIAAENAKSRQG